MCIREEGIGAVGVQLQGVGVGYGGGVVGAKWGGRGGVWGGFFFKQKPAYDVEYGLVGSEMGIRDRGRNDPENG